MYPIPREPSISKSSTANILVPAINATFGSAHIAIVISGSFSWEQWKCHVG